MVVCGGFVLGRGDTREVWRLNLGEMRWERMGDLVSARSCHACCTACTTPWRAHAFWGWRGHAQGREYTLEYTTGRGALRESGCMRLPSSC